MKSPKVSVLMPTYNYARYLPEAIESVLEQDYEDFELLIIDDSSSDNSAEVIRSYAARDKRIRFQINSPNLGMVPNWNLCMQMACGQYLRFLFGDDALASRSALGKLAAMLDEHPEATLAASARKIVDQDSRPINIWAHLGKPGLKRGNDIILQCLDQTRNLIGEPSAVMFRKRDAGRGFDVRYRQIVDQEFWMRLLATGDLVYTPEPLCSFRIHSSQQTAVNREHQVGEKEQLLLLEDYLEKPLMKGPDGRRVVFNNLYRIKRNRRGAPASDLEKMMMQSLGPAWYSLYWIRYKVLRPFLNAQHSILKRYNGIRFALSYSREKPSVQGTKSS